MLIVLFFQIFSDSIKSNNPEYDKIINEIYFSNLKTYKIDEDSLEKIKTSSIVKGYKYKVFKFENIIETFRSITIDGKSTIEHSDPKDVEIYIFYENNKILFYVVKETYLGLNRRVYVNLYSY